MSRPFHLSIFHLSSSLVKLPPFLRYLHYPLSKWKDPGSKARLLALF